MHKPIQLKDVCLFFPHKICFEDFSAHIPYGSRIAIIGRNGVGKSSLLQLLLKDREPSHGEIIIPQDAVIDSVPQLIEAFEDFSGGQRFHKKLTQALQGKPNVLLLDEPTNHLDTHNKNSLIRLLRIFPGTVVVVTHDKALLQGFNTLWHIENGKIKVFSGSYEDYISQTYLEYNAIQSELTRLRREKRDMHEVLMQEQNRASRSRQKGEKSIANNKWPTIVSKAKAKRAEMTSGRKKSLIAAKKDGLLNKLNELHLPKVILPKFSIQTTARGSNILSISQANIGYGSKDGSGNKPIVTNMSLSVTMGETVAIKGRNGSGKSTLFKAILNNPVINKSGSWCVPKIEDIGYLDQHYQTLNPNLSVYDTIQQCVPHWGNVQIRNHLSDFLFHQNEEILTLVTSLSGGERCRLSLAVIAAKTPKLLLLDEITNNLDLETKEHVVQVLKQYPGAMLVISHDEAFLEDIGIDGSYEIKDSN